MKEFKPGLNLLWERLSASQPDSAQPSDLVELGRIGEPYGVKGWINVHPHSGDNTALKQSKTWHLKRPEPLRVAGAFSSAPAGDSSGAAIAVGIVAARMHSGRLVAQLAGIDDRSQAELLKGAPVWVSRSSFPPLKKGEFYWVDLLGLRVLNREGVMLGLVTEVTDHGAHPILCLDAGEGLEERLIPFVPAYVDSVDLAERVISVDWQADY